MYYKLAINNIRKSYKDYLVYFITVAFGICLFYLFNSIESQHAMLILDSNKIQALKMLNGALSYVSSFMSVVLAFLMVYANQFLIKRRKKELGIYMVLGMNRFKISYILVLETFLIGLISLFIGLVMGIVGSHFLSILTANLFVVDMKEFHFIFSKGAFTKSIINFSFIYLIVMFLNVINITRVKLIDLIYAKNKNQEIKVKSMRSSLVIFLFSLIILAISYYCIQKNGMLSIDRYFKTSIVLGLLGTFLFFMSLSGILLQVFKLNKKIYYSNLNMFSLRQINSKVNTTYIMISILCILLLIAIGTFSTGMGITSVVSGNLDQSLPFDMTLEFWINPQEAPVNIPDYSSVGDYYNFTVYESDIKIDDLVDLSQYSGSIQKEFLVDYPVEVIKLSDYNTYLKNTGKKEVDLNQEFIIISNVDGVQNLYKDYKGSITIEDHQLNSKAFKNQTVRNEMTLSSLTLLVIEDKYVEKMTPVLEEVNFTKLLYGPEKTSQMVASLSKNSFYIEMNREQVLAEAIGLKTIIAYIALYVGFVFIMTTVACLALQQLSDASDNVERYNLLRKLGVDTSIIKHSLLVQIAVYFFMPLGLAIIHSIVGIDVASRVVSLFGQLDILKNMVITSVFVVFIYGSYFIVTYTAASAMVLKVNPIRKES